MEKTDIVIVSICITLLVLWFIRHTPVTPPPPSPAQSEQRNFGQSGAETVSDTNGVHARADHNPQTPLSDLSAVEEAPPRYADPLFDDPPPAKPVVLNSGGVCEFTIDPELGGLTTSMLHNFRDRDEKHAMKLGSRSHPVFQVRNDNQRWSFSDAIVDSVDSRHVTVSRAVANTALVLTQSWTVSPDNAYDVDYTVTITNRGDASADVKGITVNTGAMQPLETAKGFMGAAGLDQRVDILTAGKHSPKTINIDKIKKFDSDDIEQNKGWEHEWIAVQNKYFVSLVGSKTPFPGCELFTLSGEEEQNESESGKWVAGRSALPATTVAAGGSREWRMTCYVGPKKYDLLKQLGRNQESILQFDLFLFFHFEWMKGISLGILWGLNQLQSLFHNYGIAIIIVTIIIRAVFWPITQYSTTWSKKMQKLQPLAQEIREKYKNDPQKMQMKTMELYREHKVNPVAGCLPMLLQIPVFFALFNVLRSAIELRQARFLWASDLSRPDSIATLPLINLPLNPLALLMGVTMYFQQKMMPTSPDPVQQKVMSFMTLFFVLILYTMPSGLTLYWTINQVISILQYKLTHNVDDRKS